MSEYWKDYPAFKLLCDIVASNSLVCVTGAGISIQLRQEFNRERKLPGWVGLIRELRGLADAYLSEEEKSDCDRILAEDYPAGDLLIEAATIISCKFPNYDQELRRLVTAAHETTNTHLALWDLMPRGILTFNYDCAHEVAASNLCKEITVVLPDDEHNIVRLLGKGVDSCFLLKAHGSTKSTSPLVLDYHSYRDLIVSQPAYRAFVQHLFSNFHLCIVGFGLSDPDFDLFVNGLAATYGSPLHTHVVIRHSKDTSAREVLWRRRFGFHVLPVNDYGDIPAILASSIRTPGPSLEGVINDCIFGDLEKRKDAHKELKTLGPAGKVCAVAKFEEIASRYLQPKTNQEAHYLSEAVYSMGLVAPHETKALAKAVVTSQTQYSAPAARALAVLRYALDLSDLDWLDNALIDIARAKYQDDPSNRIEHYLRELRIFVPSRIRSDAGLATS